MKYIWYKRHFVLEIQLKKQEMELNSLLTLKYLFQGNVLIPRQKAKKNLTERHNAF